MKERDGRHGTGGSSVGKIGRRELIDWLGRGATLALLSPLIEACESVAGPHSDLPGVDAPFPDLSVDAPSGDAAPEGTPDATGPCGPDDFQPADDLPPGVGPWYERTVDAQDLPSILASWTLTVDGLCAAPRAYTFCELRDLGLVSQVTDFHCVEGWSVLDVPWDGVPLGKLVGLAKPLPEARFLTFTSVRGVYTESLAIPIAMEPRTLLGLGVGGRTLPLAHGFPCRIVIPRLLGYKNAKYVTRITFAAAELTGFWPAYGYPVAGEVPPARLREGKY